MGAEVIFLSPLCIIMYVRFAGSKIKCYFYLEDLQKQNVEKKNTGLLLFQHVSVEKRSYGSFFITLFFELNSCNADCALRFLIKTVSILIID